jgi:molybdopterin-guanine dinucleotide biosynthesis protein A
MNNQDKGLVMFRGKMMVEYALSVMSTVVDQVFINANRNQAQYQQFGVPVIADQTDSFDGPLAGVLTAMMHCQGDVLLVMPCDTPLVGSEHLQKLLHTLLTSGADITVAFDGERMHPVFLALKTNLQASLEAFLASGERKIDRWLTQHNLVKVDFSDQQHIFRNINTLEELSDLEAGKL